MYSKLHVQRENFQGFTIGKKKNVVTLKLLIYLIEKMSHAILGCEKREPHNQLSIFHRTLSKRTKMP